MRYVELIHAMAESITLEASSISYGELGCRILNLPFASEAARIVPQLMGRELAGSLSREESRAALSDVRIVENHCFVYPVLTGLSAAKAERVIVLFHGLNERRWDRYIGWAQRLRTQTGAAVLLFPMAFHMNRAPGRWSDPRRMIPVSRLRSRRLESAGLSSFANAALSIRIDEYPQRFFWSGLISYLDVVQLIRQIRANGNPAIDRNAHIDVFGYSIGALLAQLLLVGNPDGQLGASRGFLFCGGTTLGAMHPASRHILDTGAGERLQQYCEQSSADKSWFNRLLASGYAGLQSVVSFFSSMLNTAMLRDLRESRLRQIASRISAVALERDEVVPGAAIASVLRGARGDIPTEVEVLDFPHRYTHEDPFPVEAAPLVNDSFDAVFSRAAARLA